MCVHLPSQLPEYKHDYHCHHQHSHEDDGEEEEKNEYDKEQELTSDLLSLACDLSLEQLQPWSNQELEICLLVWEVIHLTLVISLTQNVVFILRDANPVCEDKKLTLELRNSVELSFPVLKLKTWRRQFHKHL